MRLMRNTSPLGSHFLSDHVAREPSFPSIGEESTAE
jgi:hypothetical protein